jgi:hypothetical protein
LLDGSIVSDSGRLILPPHRRDVALFRTWRYGQTYQSSAISNWGSPAAGFQARRAFAGQSKRLRCVKSRA